MSPLRLWRALRRRRMDDEILREEIASHLAALESQFRSQGLSEEAARVAARRQFGNVTSLREQTRQVFGFSPVERLGQDLRYAARALRASPGFTAFTLLTLALGIGANTTMFSLVNGVLLRPLPFREPDRLMMLEETLLPRFPRFELSPLDFLSWHEQSRSFSEMAAFKHIAANLTDGDRPERVLGARVSANLTSLLGVEPQLGRGFRPEEDVDGGPSVVLLGHDLWRSRFGGDAGVVGRSITLNGVGFTVVGVMPQGFHFPDPAALWIPMRFTAKDLTGRNNHIIWAVGRLAPGVTRDEALAEMRLIQGRLPTTWSPNVVRLTDHYVGEVRVALFVLLGAAGLVLLIACVNIASLLMARASVRQREISLRAALGASRGRIIQQLLTESVALALPGGALGILLGYFGVAAVSKLPITGVARLELVTVDYPVLVFSSALTIVMGILFGLAPAFRLSSLDLRDGLASGSRVSGADARTRLRKVLVVSEVALAVVLLTGAGLLLKSLAKLSEVRSGLNPESVLTATINLPPVAYPEPYQRARFVEQLVERVRGAPNVRGVAVSTGLPFLEVEDSGIRFDGRPNDSPLTGTAANHYRVTPDYLRVMQIPLVRGRLLTERDTSTSPPVVLINETMARRYFPDEDPIGKRLDISGPTYLREIVGIVGDVKQEGFRRPTAPQVYEAFYQKPAAGFTVVVRGTGDPMDLAESLRHEVLAVDKHLPISQVRAMTDIVAGTTVRDRVSSFLLSLFAALALVLASIGIYGLIAYSVTQRTREIGIRVALGASRGRILSLILGQSAVMVSLGLSIGLVASVGLARVLTSLLYEVTPRDPLTLAVASLVLLGVALPAALVPALRALHVKPVVALRLE